MIWADWDTPSLKNFTNFLRPNLVLFLANPQTTAIKIAAKLAKVTVYEPINKKQKSAMGAINRCQPATNFSLKEGILSAGSPFIPWRRASI